MLVVREKEEKQLLDFGFSKNKAWQLFVVSLILYMFLTQVAWNSSASWKKTKQSKQQKQENLFNNHVCWLEQQNVSFPEFYACDGNDSSMGGAQAGSEILQG